MAKKPTNWMQYSGVGIQMAATMMIGLWLGGKVGNYFSLPEKLFCFASNQCFVGQRPYSITWAISDKKMK